MDELSIVLQTCRQGSSHSTDKFQLEKMEPSHLFHLSGTVILRIWWQIILMVIYTTGVLLLIKHVEQDLGSQCSQPFIPVLGVATALLLVFRTNTAYDRYWEGRNLWSKLCLNIRTLTRCIWVMVEAKEENDKEVVQKTHAINLLVAFAYATKNHLREDYTYHDRELREFVGHLPIFRKAKSSEMHDEQKYSREEANGNGKDFNTSIPENSGNTHKTKLSRKCSIVAFETTVENNIPIEISYHIAAYIDSVRRRELVDAPTTLTMINALNNLIECLGGFERILRTPIPLAYSVHLHQATWLYLLALPFQLFGALNWFTIPAVAIAAFALLGILGIGREIENPFGYDDNDLPLDDFCHAIRREAATVMRYSKNIPES